MLEECFLLRFFFLDFLECFFGGGGVGVLEKELELEDRCRFLRAEFERERDLEYFRERFFLRGEGERDREEEETCFRLRFLLFRRRFFSRKFLGEGDRELNELELGDREYFRRRREREGDRE